MTEKEIDLTKLTPDELKDFIINQQQQQIQLQGLLFQTSQNITNAAGLLEKAKSKDAPKL